MTTPILHHYPMSPFAEKARLMLGFKGLAWQSVYIPSVMPKPDVVALTGGYRRTPLLQIGADIWCDTALIATVLEHLQPAPALFPDHLKGIARIVAQWADSELFWSAMGYTLSPKGAAAMFANQPPEAAQAFAADRGAHERRHDPPAPGRRHQRLPQPPAAPRPHAATNSPFCWAARPASPTSRPTTRCGSAAWSTPAWPASSTPRPACWPGWTVWPPSATASRPKLTSTEAIAIAAAAEPAPLPQEAFQDDHGIALGSRVTVAAQSFGTETTEGTLVAATRTHVTLARTDERAGRLHVHFPRIGYVLKEVKA